LDGNSNNLANLSIPAEVEGAIDAMGLNLATIRLHQRHVAQYLSSGTSCLFKISDSCRINNGGIMPFPKVSGVKFEDVPIVAFVPAAGASSRYLMPMTDLVESLRQLDHQMVMRRVTELLASGVASCPLPDSFQELIRLVKSGVSVIPKELAARVLVQIDAPKALYPAVTDGLTFLDVKRIEHEAIGVLSGEIYVCPPNKRDDFLHQANSKQRKLTMKCYEQGPSLATVRFDSSASVALDEAGQPSYVPAGHGALAHLLPKVKLDFPEARGVFIRNIDNIAGTSDEVLSSSRQFLNVFRESLLCVDAIRQALSRQDSSDASKYSRQLLILWGIEADANEDPLSKVLSRLFHTDLSKINDAQAIFARPFVLMGQVPNTKRDVGGTCVFADVGGKVQKLCLELPHASSEDRKIFLEDPAKATHFNPVFVAAEILDNSILHAWADHPFWLVAKKSWRGRDVYYQESILYELLGSSQHCNVIFVEIPRILFNPHKTLFDAVNKTSDFWLS
jgi:hypothetical protein